MGKQRLFIAVAVLAFAAVACSSKTPTPSAGGTTPPSSPTASASPLTNKGTADASATTGKFELELDNEGTTEFYFKPTFVKVKPGQILTLDLKNQGSTEHNFTISSLGIEKDIEAGKEIDVNVTFPSAGGTDVQFFCRYHVTKGMRGAFFFGATPQATAASTGSGSGYGY